MEQEFRISTGMKIVYGLLAAVLVVFSLFLFCLPIQVKGARWAFMTLPVLFLTGTLFIVVNLFRRRVVIDGYRILCVNLFSTKELALTQIRGYRISRKTIWIEPLSSDDHRILIGNYADFAGSEKLLQWVKADLIDLDAIDLKKEQEDILQDPGFGDTEEERKENFSKAGKVANMYNVVGLVLMFALIFMRNKPADVFALCYPLIGVILMVWSKGIIKFASDTRRSTYPSIILGIFPPALMLMIRTVNEYTVMRLQDMLIPTFVVSGIMFTLLYVKGINRSIGAKGAQILFMLFTALAIGFGSVGRINCEFDTSKPAIYTASVLDHRVAHGKSTSYFLTLGPWGPRLGVKEVNVNRSLYQQVAAGDSVRVVLRDGVLRIPWFFVMKD